MNPEENWQAVWRNGRGSKDIQVQAIFTFWKWWGVEDPFELIIYGKVKGTCTVGCDVDGSQYLQNTEYRKVVGSSRPR